jgi:hypothetical protein
MDLREIGWGGMDWNHLAQDRDQWKALVNMLMNLKVPYNVGKFLSSCTTGSSMELVSSGEVGSCEHGNEPSGCVKCLEFLDRLSKYYFLKMDSAPWN